MITDLVQIKLLGEKKQGENERFRKYLKRHNFPDLKFRRVAEEIEEQIDCRACANCCKVAETDITKRDAARLAQVSGDYAEAVRAAVHDGFGVRGEGADPAAARRRAAFFWTETTARFMKRGRIPAAIFRIWCAARARLKAACGR